MTLDAFLNFILPDIRTARIYQPGMIRHLVRNKNRGAEPEIARALLIEHQSQMEYYCQITIYMVMKVLRRREVVE